MIKKFIKLYLDGKDTSDFSWKFLLAVRAFLIRCKNLEPNYLKINRELRNKYSGKRCFILGNGPSLNNLDFKDLKDEYVFTVNMLMEHERFEELNPNFHVIVDGEIFNTSEKNDLDKDYYIQKLEKLYQFSDLTLFVPINNRQDVIRNGIDKKINVRYLQSYYYYKSIGNIEIDKTIPEFNKVIQYAIAIASYMGFNEINLLGCEETSIMPFINLIMKGETSNDHCYVDSDEEKKSWKIQLDNEGISWVFEDQSRVFKRYNLISAFCNKKGIILQNLTPRSLIDSIRKVPYESVIERKHQ